MFPAVEHPVPELLGRSVQKESPLATANMNINFQQPWWQVLFSSPVDTGDPEKGRYRPEATEPEGGRDRIQVQWSRAGLLSWPMPVLISTQ